MRIIQIGCNNGNDEVYKFISSLSIVNFALLIDANPFVLELAKNFYKDIPNVIFDCLLVSDKNEKKNFHIPHFKHHKFSAHSSTSIEHLIKHDHVIDEVKTFETNSISTNDLFRKYKIKELDYLFIDCEGEDYNIINSINLLEFDIKSIKFEHVHLDGPFECGSNYDKLIDKLQKHGYTCCRFDDGNTIAKK